MIHFYVITLFPELFETFFHTSIVRKGLEKGAFDYTLKNIRDHAINRYGQVDDAPYGGGAGMLLRPEPIFKAYDSLNIPKENRKILFFSPKGRKIDHNYIIGLTKEKNIGLICGHYEGVDQRVLDSLVDEEISIGDFVLTGGEIPAMALIDAIIRQLNDVIRKESLKDESFSSGLLEYRQYTRPAVYRGMDVPSVLLSGNHKEIDNYKITDSIKETLKWRPDLINNYQYDDNIQLRINKMKRELENVSDHEDGTGTY